MSVSVDGSWIFYVLLSFRFCSTGLIILSFPIYIGFIVTVLKSFGLNIAKFKAESYQNNLCIVYLCCLQCLNEPILSKYFFFRHIHFFI